MGYVAALAFATTKGVGKDRQLRQVVLFCMGTFRALLEEALAKWNHGATAARAGNGGRAKVKPMSSPLQVVKRESGARAAPAACAFARRTTAESDGNEEDM